MIHALEEVMADDTDTVRFTVGRLEVAPGSPNTVPGRVSFTIDFRHPVQDVINHLTDQIEPVCHAHARGCEVIVAQLTNVAPTRFDPVIIHTVRQHAAQLGL